MKVIKSWKLSYDDSYLWWKWFNDDISDESYLVMQVKEVEIAKEVIRNDGWWRFACGDV